MSKKGRLSKAELYTIHNMLIEGKKSTEIAKFLDRTPDTIKKVVDQIEKNINEVLEEENPPKKNKSNKPSVVNSMTNPKAEKGKRPIVMTQSASQRTDKDPDGLKYDPPSQVSRSARGHLYDSEGNPRKTW